MAHAGVPDHDPASRAPAQGASDWGIALLAPSGHVLSVSASCTRIIGNGNLRGQHFSVLYIDEDVTAGRPADDLDIALANGRSASEGWLAREDGSRFWASVVMDALLDDAGELHGFSVLVRDEVERPHGGLAGAASRQLLGRVVAAQEQERRRIAWEVHDESIQAMVAVDIRLRLMARKVPAEQATQFDELRGSVGAAIEDLRDLVMWVRPPAIEEEGLKSVLTDYLEEVADLWGLSHELRVRLDGEPSVENAITLYRICQEALANVRRHARATSVEVTVSTTNNGTLLRVSDNGIGFDGVVSGPRHFGLVEMRERAELAGGWCTVTGTPDVGTLVECWVPDDVM